MAVEYLDLDLLINGLMDAFLLSLTGKLLSYPVGKKRLLAAALLGEIPVILAVYQLAPWLEISKFIVPVMMVGVVFRGRGIIPIGKALLGFWLLSAAAGGFIYSVWNWASFQGPDGGGLSLVLANLWLLPVAFGLWWGGQRLWQYWQVSRLRTVQGIFEVEIDFGNAEQTIVIRALLDTGNQLRDPLTKVPVLLLEEEIALPALPDNIRAFAQTAWREKADPWPLLWQSDSFMMQRLVFIPYKGVEKQAWLLGIRPRQVKLAQGGYQHDIAATVALVQQQLSGEGDYQGLLHPEHIQSGG